MVIKVRFVYKDESEKLLITNSKEFNFRMFESFPEGSSSLFLSNVDPANKLFLQEYSGDIETVQIILNDKARMGLSSSQIESSIYHFNINEESELYEYIEFVLK